MIHSLSVALFDKSLAIPEFPERKDICGIGMSDWDGYAVPLAKKLDYTNTFYHKQPFLDIMNIRQKDINSVDFLLSSDVFEHVVPPISTAFQNVMAMLKQNGAFVFSVPYTLGKTTKEHFPALYDYHIVSDKQNKVLKNITKEGREELFENLIFHGGVGATLEMRIFSESALINELHEAGFSDVHIMRDHFFNFGIYWPRPWSLPIIARKNRGG